MLLNCICTLEFMFCRVRILLKTVPTVSLTPKGILFSRASPSRVQGQLLLGYTGSTCLDHHRLDKDGDMALACATYYQRSPGTVVWLT